MTNLERPIGWCTHWFILKFLIKENMSIDFKMYKEYKTGEKIRFMVPHIKMQNSLFIASSS